VSKLREYTYLDFPRQRRGWGVDFPQNEIIIKSI